MSGWTTERLRVEVHLANRRVLRGEVHLQAGSRLHGGPERPEEMLNREEPFFALVLDEGHPLFIAKEHVLYLQLPPQPAIDDPDRALAAHRFELELELSDGSVQEGIVMSELPPDRPRALDFLNASRGFIAVWAPDGVRVVNARYLRLASPAAGLPRA
ncbi:MAG: hypothetical protein FJ206_08530 [Gemmatimonadetes bacterium]|nr:hypothetical protein [Gemmatimonadota bacterium]